MPGSAIRVASRPPVPLTCPVTMAQRTCTALSATWRGLRGARGTVTAPMWVLGQAGAHVPMCEQNEGLGRGGGALRWQRGWGRAGDTHPEGPFPWNDPRRCFQSHLGFPESLLLPLQRSDPCTLASRHIYRGKWSSRGLSFSQSEVESGWPGATAKHPLSQKQNSPALWLLGAPSRGGGREGPQSGPIPHPHPGPAQRPWVTRPITNNTIREFPLWRSG